MGNDSKTITPLGVEYDKVKIGKTPNTEEIVAALLTLNQGCNSGTKIVLH